LVAVKCFCARRDGCRDRSIAEAVVVLARRSVYDLPTVLICGMSLAVLLRWKVPEPVVTACPAAAGLLLHHAWFGEGQRQTGNSV
jgi:hypothetical protein